MRTLNDVIRVDGYIKPACEQTKSVFNELAVILKMPTFKQDKIFSNESLEFIAAHLSNITAYVKIDGDDEITKLIRRLSNIETPKTHLLHFLFLSMHSLIYIILLMKNMQYKRS